MIMSPVASPRMRTSWMRIRLIAVTVTLAAMSAAAGLASAADADGACTAVIPIATESRSKTLTADLTSIPAAGIVFRAELVLRPIGHLQDRALAATKVYPTGQPERPLKFVAPRFVSLDALEAVAAARQAGKPLALVAENTINGVDRRSTCRPLGQRRTPPPRPEMSCRITSIRENRKPEVRNVCGRERQGNAQAMEVRENSDG